MIVVVLFLLGIVCGFIIHRYSDIYPSLLAKDGIDTAVAYLKEEHILNDEFEPTNKFTSPQHRFFKRDDEFNPSIKDNIPIVWYFFGSKVNKKSICGLLVELMAGAGVVYIYNHIGQINLDFIFLSLFWLWGITVSLLDMKTTYITDNFSYPLILFAFGAPIFGYSLGFSYEEIVKAMLPFVVLYIVFMRLPVLLLGGGDIKILIGFAGLFGLTSTVVATLLTPFFFFAYYIAIWIKDKISRKESDVKFSKALPAGPFFIIAMFAVLWYQQVNPAFFELIKISY